MLAALAASAARRSRTYWLLARLVLERPDAPLLAELDTALAAAATAPASDEALAGEVSALAAAVRAARSDPKALVSMQMDYIRLFGAIAKCRELPAPFESVVLESRLMGDSTLAVEACYREAGFDAPAPDAGPPDHLGAELRFLALAAYREMEAWQAGNRAQAADWLERERRFLDEHVLAWVPQHCAQLAQSAETAFYCAVLSLIGQACMVDHEDVVLLTEQTALQPAPVDCQALQ